MSVNRTWMFIPGNQQRRLRKVKELDADVFIYDLEDSVPYSEKDRARQIVANCILEYSHLQNFVRVNDINTDYFLKDIQSVFVKGLKGIVLPIVNGPEDILRVETILDELEDIHRIMKGSTSVVPLIESALGIYYSVEIAKSSTRINHLAFGAIDYTLDINATITPSGMELLYARSQLVIASRVAGIEAPIDTVFMDVNDNTSLKHESKFVKELGFQGKLSIHPNQISIINEVFTPSEAEIMEAKEVISAFNRANKEGKAAIQLNGKMIDYPVVKRAQKLYAKAKLLGLTV
jgi:citrate lyase subunit beta / citryl-CoA lyase